MSTLIENVYMAKLAVLMSVPKKLMIHCPLSSRGGKGPDALFDVVALGNAVGMVVLELALHDTVLSERRKPRSRASCSNVIGMKDPTPHTTKTSAAQP